MNMLEIARAACEEVGLDPKRIERHPDVGRLRSRSLGHPRRLEYLRAMWLAACATQGPETLVRCPLCSPEGTSDHPCIPVRDALRGLTCGRTS